MTFYQILWTFFFYSFAGWCCEVVFAACKTGKFVNRGFLLGPVCPIYGFGVTAAVLLIAPIQAHWLQAYLVATLVPTIIEYFVGWLADKLLHVRLWDYSGMPLNLNGYVCLLFSLVWGLACLFIVAVFHPMVLHLLAWVPTIPGWILLALFTATILTDFILTALEGGEDSQAPASHRRAGARPAPSFRQHRQQFVGTYPGALGQRAGKAAA